MTKNNSKLTNGLSGVSYGMCFTFSLLALITSIHHDYMRGLFIPIGIIGLSAVIISIFKSEFSPTKNDQSFKLIEKHVYILFVLVGLIEMILMTYFFDKEHYPQSIPIFIPITALLLFCLYPIVCIFKIKSVNRK